MKRGIVRPSSIVIAPGRADRDYSSAPIANAKGMLGAIALGAGFWAMVAFLLF